MKRFVFGLALVTVACAQYSEYSPPLHSVGDDLSGSTEYLNSAILADDGYRYKTVRRLRHRIRRDVSELINADYLPPHQEQAIAYAEPTISSVESFQELSAGYEQPATNYAAPVEQEQTALANDGYRYKTVRRLRHRNRRDVSELSSADDVASYEELLTDQAEPTTSYLAPQQEEASVDYVETTPVEQEQTNLAYDGYRYKTARRLRYRNRRDVSELSSAEYEPSYDALPIEHDEPTTSYLAPQQEEASLEYVETAPVEQEQTTLANDGYRYKTVRRLRHRNRRDVSELASAEYLPPHQEFSTENIESSTSYLAPQQEEAAVEYIESAPVEQEQTVLANDGYRYKTVRRLRHRNRRDVSELASAEYLPPHQELSIEHIEPATAYLAPQHEQTPVEYVESAPIEQEQTLLANDGYRYKTVRRLRHRNRRDVSELASAEYLPPHQELSTEYIEPATSHLAPQQEEIPVEYAETAPIEQEQTILANDGYRYKTVRRLRHRNRRDVSELLSSAEYLPPHQELSTEYLAPQQEEVAVEYGATPPVEQEPTILANDGYRYKTVRRLRHRNRRDVSELSSAEYLPPLQEFSTEHIEPAISYLAPQHEEAAVEYIESAPVEQEQTVLANDGYRYKTVRKFKVRRH